MNYFTYLVIELSCSLKQIEGLSGKVHINHFEKLVKFEVNQARVSAVNSGRLRFGGQWSRNFSSKLKNRIITFNLHYFVFLFLTVYNFSHSPVISVALLFLWVV